MRLNKQTQSGFALLMTLIVVSVVISVGLTLIDLTIKQIRLSSGSRDSENAFHAANAGVECLRYWRLASSTNFEVGDGDDVPMSCFGSAVTRPSVVDRSPVASPGTVFQYDVQFTWGVSGDQRCSDLSFITLSTDPTSAGVTLTNVPSYLPGYPETDKSCLPGGRCTIVSVQGYNKPCSSVNQIGTVQREVLLEL